MRVLASVLAVGLVLVACAESDSTGTPPTGTSSSSSSASSSGGGRADSGDGCEKKTCETVAGACGQHDDGCGGTFSCGACPPANPCTPLTCERLGKTCGTHDDGCASVVSCGACTTSTCAKDAKEPNDKAEQATDLGAANDSDDTVKNVKALASSDGDEDWFKMKTSDAGFTGNPAITATVTDTKLEVTLFHRCDSQPDYSTCIDDTVKRDDAIGHGCRANATVKINTECQGIDETGTTFIRVRKTTTDQACHAYELTVKVE